MTEEIHLINGMRVHVLPNAVEVKRSWAERWLSFPWRPRVKTKWVENSCAPVKDQVWQAFGALYVRADTYEDLKKELTARSRSTLSVMKKGTSVIDIRRPVRYE